MESQWKHSMTIFFAIHVLKFVSYLESMFTTNRNNVESPFRNISPVDWLHFHQNCFPFEKLFFPPQLVISDWREQLSSPQQQDLWCSYFSSFSRARASVWNLWRNGILIKWKRTRRFKYLCSNAKNGEIFMKSWTLRCPSKWIALKILEPVAVFPESRWQKVEQKEFAWIQFTSLDVVCTLHYGFSLSLGICTWMRLKFIRLLFMVCWLGK